MARYDIAERQTGDLLAYHLLDSSRRAEAVLYPALGNNCLEFRTTPAPLGLHEEQITEPVALFVPPAHPSEMRQGSPFHSGQPILFPFPNRVRDGVYTFEGKTYRMDKLLATGWDRGAGQAIHGLVADKSWSVEESHADNDHAFVRSVLQLDAFPDIFEQYPFPCRLAVTYTLRDGTLEMRTEVTNTGDANLPMGFGIHPWFPVALRPGATLPAALEQITPEQRAQALVRVPAAALWELDKLMPTGKTIPADTTSGAYDLREFRPLNDQFFDDVFTQVQHRDDGWSEGGLRDPATRLEMFIAADPQFREWVLYAPLNRQVIALEPYTCVTDAVNLQAQGIDAGLITVAPGQTWRGDIHFGLRRF